MSEEVITLVDNKNVSTEASNTTEADVVIKNPVSELVFLGIMFAVVLAALITATGYHPVSARAPIVVMTPLLLLIVFLGIRLIKASNRSFVTDFIQKVIKDKESDNVKIIKFCGWMIALCGLIFVTGHYVGSAVFMFILLYFYGKEKLKLSIILTVVATVVLFLIFEEVFSIELYRGLIYRYFMGYDIF